jgi:polysaccharide biosynthesis/export protein
LTALITAAWLVERCAGVSRPKRRGFGKEQVLRQARVIKRVATVVAMALASGALVGCDIASFIDPAETNVVSKTLQKPILTSISTIDPSVDDPDETFLNATEIKQGIDNTVIAQDYRIGVGDMISVTVNDLVGLGVETTKQTRVSESGNISMPLLGQIKAVGLTEDELQKAISDAYRNGQIITNAQVSCSVVEARARTFQALGSVAPGEYAIPKADFRLLDALVMMRDVAQTTDDIYIIRQISEDPSATGTTPAKPVTPAPTGLTPTTPPPAQPAPGVDPLAPKGGAVLSGPSAMNTQAVSHTQLLQVASDPLAVKSTGSNGGQFQFGTPTGTPDTRTIHVPLGPLRKGDMRYNIVIRPKDLLVAPLPPTGNYYLSGHSARPGVYGLPPRGITLKQAIIAAGMLDGVAIPQRTELIRRVGPNREAFVRLDLAAIFNGEQPDMYLKPEDILHVGTNMLAPFISAVRGGFRFSYGFGFIYDRNLYTGNNGF